MANQLRSASLKQSNLLGILLVVALGILGGSIATYAMNWGPWVGSDSIEYFEAAQNLANGRGLVLIRASGNTVPMTLRPPLYPIVLAMASIAGVESVEASRMLNALLLTIFLIVLGISFQVLVQSILLTLSVVLITLASLSVYGNFTGAMSEPLFLTLAIASLLSIVWFSQKGQNRTILIVGAACAGLSLLARFIGIAGIVVGAIALVALNGRTLRRKIGDVVLFAGIGLIPFLIWTLVLAGGGSQPGEYDLPTGPLWTATIPVRIEFVNVLWDWFPIGSVLPSLVYDSRLVILIVLAITSGLVAVVATRRSGISPAVAFQRPSLQIALIFIGFALIYAIFLTATYLVVSVPKPALVDRLLFPVPLALAIGFLSLWYFIGALIGIKVNAGAIPLAASVLIATANIASVVDFVDVMHREGSGYTGRRWQGSEAIAALQDLPIDRVVVSNQTDAIQFFLGRPAYELPELGRAEPLAEFQAFGHQPETAAESAFRDHGAALALFDTVYWDFQKLYGDATDERLSALISGLYVYAELSDGTIYFWDEASAP